MRFRIKLLIGVLFLALVIFLNSILSIAAGNAVLAEVLVAIDEETLADSKEEEDEDPEEEVTADDTEYVVGVNCYDELHKMILETDIDKLTGNESFIKTKEGVIPIKDGRGEPINIKTYLNLYALAAEICLREEINPKGSDVKIEPLDLIGESFAECGLMNYDSQIANSVCVFESEDSLTSGEFAISQEALKLQPGADWGSAWSREASLAESYKLYNCHDFFGQAVFYSYLWDAKWGDAGACIYISTAENPDLDTSKRAVHGSRENIYNNGGKYVDGNFWSNYDGQSTASTDEIATSIKEGNFIKGQEFGYKTRPSSYFLPDCMYTHALHLRSFLLGRRAGAQSILDIGASDTWSVSNFDKLCPSLDADQKQYLAVVKKMYALTRFTGDNTYPSTVYSSDPSSPGNLAKVYAELVNKKINPLVFRWNPDVDLRSTCIGACNNICAVFIHGVAETMTAGTQIYKQFEKYQGKKIKLDAAIDQKILGCGGNHTTYGFDSINAGDLAKPAFEAQIKGAYQKAPKPKSSKPDTIVKAKQDTTNLCWPLKSEYNKIAADGYFGHRTNDDHPGIDIIANPKSTVYSIASGEIIEISQHTYEASGKYVGYIIIKHGVSSDFGFYSMYYNVLPKDDLKVGDTVEQRATIGTVADYNAEMGYYSDKQQPISNTSYLHLSVYIHAESPSEVYNLCKDSYEQYPNEQWEQDNRLLGKTSFNPAYLSWYDNKTESANLVKLLTHNSEDLKSIYESQAGYKPEDEYYTRWWYSLNNQVPSSPDETPEVFAYDVLPSSFCGWQYKDLKEGQLPEYKTIISKILADAMQINSTTNGSSAAVGGVTSIDGKLACIPPLAANYFTTSHITQGYGCPCEHYILKGGGGHAGIDFGSFGGVNPELYAVAHGTVMSVTDGVPENPPGVIGSGFGNRVTVLLDNDWIITYSHMFIGSIKVHETQEVNPGDLIGLIGNSGASDGAHLHLELLIPTNQYNKLFTAMKFLDTTPAPSSSTLIRGFDQGSYVRADPWLLYCLSYNYDFLHTSCKSSCESGTGRYGSYSWITNNPFKGHIIVKYADLWLDLDNPKFIAKYRKGVS